MKRTLQAVFLTVFAAQALVVGQSGEVTRVLSEIRAALGGNDRLAAVKTMAVEGQTTRPAPDGSSTAQDFEMAFELPAGAVKFMKKDVVMNIGGATISRRTGFNGSDVIDEMDTPPSMGGNIRMMRASSGGSSTGAPPTPEEAAAQKTKQLAASHREFARLALGMLGTTTTAYPVEFTYSGQADSPTGKADVLDLKSADGFTARLYVDGKTHLPLMLTWMDKEPVQVTMNASGGAAAGSGGMVIANGGTVRTFSNGSAAGGSVSSQDAARSQDEIAARMKEAEANRKTVEFRIFYADYKSFDGLRLPTRIQRMVDGLPTEEMSLDKIKVNAKIDPALFGAGK